jgi:acyl-CoA synthetase (AMP-forming)/AMP-acid ligase II
MLTMVLEHPSVARRDLSSVRSLAVGGAPIPPGLLDRAREVFVGASRRMAVSYGSTEAGGTVATGLAADAGGAMLPLSTCEVRLGSPDDAGVGEILVRSPTLMDRYLGVPDDEQPVDADGWLHTGDLGVLDAEGRLRVVGRTKDVVIRGGENVSAGYVEDALKAHPGVADVAVVGIEHPTWGEEVAASIRVVPTSDPTPEELRAFLDGRIAAFAVPTRWRISEASLPLTETGKVDKVAVRQGFEEPDERAR